jgi:hypothetical protein
MLDLSELLVAWAAPVIDVVIRAMIQVDRFNDRANRPFPAASVMLDCAKAQTTPTSKFSLHDFYHMRSYAVQSNSIRVGLGPPPLPGISIELRHCAGGGSVRI